MKTNYPAVHVRLTPAQAARLEERTQVERRTKSAIVRRALNRELAGSPMPPADGLDWGEKVGWSEKKRKP